MDDRGARGEFGMGPRAARTAALVAKHQEAQVGIAAQRHGRARRYHSRTMIAAHGVECDPDVV